MSYAYTCTGMACNGSNSTKETLIEIDITQLNFVQEFHVISKQKFIIYFANISSRDSQNGFYQILTGSVSFVIFDILD